MTKQYTEVLIQTNATPATLIVDGDEWPLDTQEVAVSWMLPKGGTLSPSLTVRYEGQEQWQGMSLRAGDLKKTAFSFKVTAEVKPVQVVRDSVASYVNTALLGVLLVMAVLLLQRLRRPRAPKFQVEKCNHV